MIFTLDSIVSQKNVNFEIVIADDDSKNNLRKDIENYFVDKCFDNWKMVCNGQNYGTVRNLHSGLEVAVGKYIKTISPGDALYGENILRNWIDYNEKNGYRWSFSDAFYYVGNSAEKKAVAVQAHPNNVMPYIKDNSETCRWNYIVLDDIALGTALLRERSLEVEYENKILDKIIYAEDNIWRMMMFDGIVAGYFLKNAVLYEYGLAFLQMAVMCEVKG